MHPVKPIVPGYDLPVTEFAKDQPEYLTLPSFRQDDGTVLTRWRLSWRERLRVLLKGNIYLYVLTFGTPLQPVMLETEPPQIHSPQARQPEFDWPTEVDVAFDLDIANYPGKWQQAQKSARDSLSLSPEAPDYWPTVRQLFLALGGQRLDGQKS